jgi:hypothetical protein
LKFFSHKIVIVLFEENYLVQQGKTDFTGALINIVSRIVNNTCFF